VYDALIATRGKMYGVENDAVYAAMDMFLKTEGIDIVPASGVAVAALKQAIETRGIKKKDTVLLNITGGGEARLRKDRKTHAVAPTYISKNIIGKEIEDLLCHDLKKSS
jgi:cysteate synthase